MARIVVVTKYGSVEGTFDGESRGGRKFYQFRGIQYAVVSERFKPSVEPTPWIGIKSAKGFGIGCDEIETADDEANCLLLNVYTHLPNNVNCVESSTLHPVVVYIHGGSFQLNSGSIYGPNYLLDEDVVFVTINYRLAVLGFLATEDEISPGNYGLKDQVMALKYIRENIINFGGDPERITLMGQSAGSASVTYHLVSPMSKGLFCRAVAESGTCLDPWSFTRKPLRYAKMIAKALGCTDCSSSTAIVKFLNTVPAKKLVDVQFIRSITSKFYNEPIAAFGPTIEPFIGDGSNSFLWESPYDLLVSGNVTKVPLLTGVVKEEGVYLWAAHVLHSDLPNAIESRKRLQDNFVKAAPFAFYFDEKVAPSSQLEETAKKVEEFYFEGKFSLEKESTFRQLAHLYSDRLFVSSAVRFMGLYSKFAPVYPFLYTFNKFCGLEFGWDELHDKYKLDATHAAELDMLISPLFHKTRVDPDHDKLSKSMVKLWVSFIATGFPTATFGSERNFPAIEKSEGLKKWYKLDTDTGLVDNNTIFAERIAFWESLQLYDNDFTHTFCCC